jgi:hypothetical protein
MKRREALATRKPRAAPTAQERQAVLIQKCELERWAKMIEKGLPLANTYQELIAQFLRRLAKDPEVLKRITTPRHHRRGRPTQASERNWRIRLDHQVTRERLGDGHGQAKRAVGEVAAAYKVSRTAVYETQACEKAAGWMDWEQYVRRRVTEDNPNLRGDDLLMIISQEMRSPENFAE